MECNQLRDLITRVLKEADLYSESAVELLMLTAAVESNLGYYIRQVKGPALGIFQMEPSTHNDIWNNYLRYKEHPEVLFDILPGSTKENDIKHLEYNLAYQILMARLHYLRVKEPLPKSDDLVGLATYWKKYYNTFKGAGTIEKAITKYNKFVVA